MAKFRKKPVVIEAAQFLEGQPLPKGVCLGLYCGDFNAHSPHLHTIHADQRVDIQFGDWVLPEPDGVHFYPCKLDIFDATYEPVSEEAQ
jgi:hypothetical protein